MVALFSTSLYNQLPPPVSPITIPVDVFKTRISKVHIYSYPAFHWSSKIGRIHLRPDLQFWTRLVANGDHRKYVYVWTYFTDFLASKKTLLRAICILEQSL